MAASSISLLTLPQTDGPDDNLPQGEERSEQFVLEVSEYFERLDVSALRFLCRVRQAFTFVKSIQAAIRSSLAHIRHSRIAPSAINAPPAGLVPPSFGVGLPSTNDTQLKKNRGLQEERIERDAWKGILSALMRLKAAQDQEGKESSAMDTND